jgi:hypothetical protein
MAFPGFRTVVIPVPQVVPTGIEVDAAAVKMVWDEFVKRQQVTGNPQSIEERYLMAILRAVNVGLETGPIIEAE